MVRWCRRLIVPVALVALIAATGCSSGKKAAPTATRPPEVVATLTAAANAPTPTVGPEGKTAVAAGAQGELVPYKDPAGRYTVKLPRGWRQEQSPNLIIMQLPLAPLTTLGIFCQPGATLKQLMQNDQATASQVGNRTVIATSDGTVAGVPGTFVTSSTTLSTLALRNNTAYFEGRGCAWRIQLTTAQAQDLSPLLDRVVQTFQFS
ncbi:MAG: hypothetical protein IVW36_11390 [Dehalococcoidia bacterium]|nr:hypothetical protein [Dehalococcoidia bacterium]